MFSKLKSFIKSKLPKKKNTYVSCEYVQHGFNVDSSDIKMCCFNCHEGGGRQILIDRYNGEMIDWNKFFKEKRKMRELNRKGIILDKCKGCIFLKEREWDDEDYLSWMVFNHWTQCNCMCRYCFNSERPEYFNTRKHFNMYPVLKQLADMGKIRGGGEIGFGGGEPALLPEFDDLVNLLLDSGCDNIRVHSSGVKYSKTITRGVSEGKLAVVCSVDSGTPETYQKIKRVQHFNEVWENLTKYAAAQTENKYKVKTKYIFYPGYNDNKEELDKWFDLTVKAGIRSVVLDVEGGWYEMNKYKVPEYLYNLLEYAAQKTQELGMKDVEFYDRACHMRLHREEYTKLRDNEQVKNS